MSPTEYEHPSDDRFSELIGLARHGDREAIGQLMAEYRNYLLMIANEGIGRDVQAKIAPSDVVQQSLLMAQQNIDQFRGESETEFRAWIRQIIKNDLVDAHRKFHQAQRRQIDKERRIDDSQQATPSIHDQHNTPRTDALAQEQAQMLQDSMKQLSEPHRRVLQLRNWQELSFAEIGQQMDCSPDAARKLWFRAVVKLQETFYRLNPGMKSSLIENIAREVDPNEP